MPQQLCPAQMNAFAQPGTFPIMGMASLRHGRRHACVTSAGPEAASKGAMREKERCAAATRAGSACEVIRCKSMQGHRMQGHRMQVKSW